MNAMRSPAAFLHPSNLITYLSLTAALAAVAAAMHGSAAGAGALIAVAALADTFDGKFARLFNRNQEQQAMGVELDGLSDSVAFGIVPLLAVALLTPWGTRPAELLWWLAGGIYAVCALTRLAFYNISHAQVAGFVGVPAPVAALIWSTVLLLEPNPTRAIAVAGITGVAMVAPIPLPRPTGAGLMLFALWPIGLLAAHLR
jgi:CDP-diacylglycerol--serine O-phosphatidyltransferase